MPCFNTPMIILMVFTLTEWIFCESTQQSIPTTTSYSTEASEPRIVIHGSSNHFGPMYSKLYSENIVFPDEYEALLKHQQLTEVPKCPNGHALCEDVDNYPYKIAQVALKHAPNIAGFFDVVQDQTEFITNRIGDSEDDNICGSIRRKIFPQIGKTSKNEWKYIVNDKGANRGHAQGVEQEICIKPNEPCLNVSPFLGFTTYCKQHYRFQRFLAIASNGEFETESFQIPSGCCCSVRREQRR